MSPVSAHLVWLLLAAASAAPAVVYDQRQEGTGYNVHVQLQDFLLIYMPGRVEDPTALIPQLSSSISLKSNHGGEYQPRPEVTLPPEYENASSQAVQEAVAAASPELPEPETHRPEANTTLTTEPPKPVKKTNQQQKVVQTSPKPLQKPQSQESNSDKSEIHQAIAVFKIKHDQQIPVKVITDPPTKPSVKKANPQPDGKITQAVIDSVKQKVEAVTEAQVRRLYDVFQTPVSQAIALFKIKQEPPSPGGKQA